jgi:histidinol-phosphatase (PHP family)
MHTHHSGDSDADPVKMVNSAIEKGLDGVCFTDHYDYGYPEDPTLFLLDFDSYRDEIEAVRAQFDGSFPVRWGIELGLMPEALEENLRVTKSYPFDFVIGSSHVVHGFDPYYPNYYEGRNEAAAYREYFESILENLKTEADFDVYGHIDYVVRYGPNKNRDYSYAKYADIIDEILRALIDRGKGIEINTAGFKYGLGHPNPTEEILLRYRELGGEILTIGSDAHKPEHIAYDFLRLPDILTNAGFKYYTIFKNRKPCFQKFS